ncbi:exodeoxyribonuclease VII large subunit [Pusillimonas sp. DMV24BSW_D]|uniref:exodeoxyribonuclease VII large subunit n=1 Tax=Neopusillimonas aestuarii TaxID=2716226 RepID=UPI00140C5040|nr:exodeoxyribonuclease VII large subunit [Pusillimonas sp. DMV24BSW_D]QIM49440.1 exodeoxyribonuclease VII large subunit [Pusillimonas sp. DMV24BSW_D]
MPPDSLVFTNGSTPADSILTVSQLNRAVGALLEGHFARIWVKGEISNFTQAASGHWYFTIKDDRAAVRAVMFRGRAQTVGLVPRVGEQFEFRAVVTLYEPRGDYQLQIDTLRRAGQGDLHEAFLRLKAKLESEGLFDPARKRPIPTMPKAVGVVTSLAAAALRDVLTSFARRAPHISVVVYPAPVQGADAPAALVQALETAYSRAEVDVILLVRGGGSLEDLWAFNDEALARTVVASPVPVICGVGHETDFSIADFVADLRAPTPTAAAELSCAPRQALLEQTFEFHRALSRHQQRLLERLSMRLDRAMSQLVSPRQRLNQQREGLQSLAARLHRAARRNTELEAARLNLLKTRLNAALPSVARRRQELDRLTQRLAAVGSRQFRRPRARLEAAEQTLQALSPKHILARGYALVRDQNGVLVKNALDLNAGDRLLLELAQGAADVEVLKTRSLL